MEIIDLTQVIEPKMPIFPIDPQPTIFPWTTIETHGFATNALFMVEHTGTHVDAPSHFIRHAKSIDIMDLETFHGSAVVLDLTQFAENALIKAADIKDAEEKNRIGKMDIVLIRTGWDGHWGKEIYLKSNPGLSADAAQYLKKMQVKLVGVDTANIDHPKASKFPVHNILLAKGIPIIENLTNLRSIEKSRFEFIAMPLKLKQGTGSPVRAIAVVEKQSKENELLPPT